MKNTAGNVKLLPKAAASATSWRVPAERMQHA
jgi:hypothetical protein